MKYLSSSRNLLATLVLASLAVFMLPACSSSEEEAPPTEDPGEEAPDTGANFEECMDECEGMNEAQCESYCENLWMRDGQYY